MFISHSYVTVMDLAPMVLEIAGAAYPDDYVTALYNRGRAFLRQGPPFDESGFELFNVAEDPGETTDLAEAEAEKYEELIRLWRDERRRLGIVLPQDL